MSILTVRATTITIGQIVIDAYTADEQREDGSYVNYLSGNGLAESIGLSNSTTVLTRMPQELKTRLGNGFTVMQGRYKMTSGGVTKVTLWSTLDAPEYWVYHSENNNLQARAIVRALVSTTLDIIINDQFHREYKAHQAQQWTENRILTKETFWFMTDAIQDYYNKNPRVERYQGQNYAEAFDTMNFGLFGKRSAKIKQELGLGKSKLNRDHFGREALKRIEMVQRIAEAQVTHCEMHPCKAVDWAIAKMHYGIIDYAE